MAHVLCLTCLGKEILQAPAEISSDDVTIWKESSVVINIQRIIWICSRPPWIYWDSYRALALFSAAAGRLLSMTKRWKQIAQQETHQTETDRD